jgi:hypothetical protein
MQHKPMMDVILNVQQTLVDQSHIDIYGPQPCSRSQSQAKPGALGTPASGPRPSPDLTAAKSATRVGWGLVFV